MLITYRQVDVLSRDTYCSFSGVWFGLTLVNYWILNVHSLKYSYTLIQPDDEEISNVSYDPSYHLLNTILLFISGL